MIKIENIEAVGLDHAIRSMRNPMNSWDKSDSYYYCNSEGWQFDIGENDLKLAKQLSKAGTDHRKFLRMINVYMDITAPLYWWKEMETYKVGTVANSCSTMHKIQDKEFTLDDFSHEKLFPSSVGRLYGTINELNKNRDMFLEHKDKEFWWQIIQLLPSSYNQHRTMMFNYEVLANIYHSRKNHKLDEWREFCKVIENLPYSELIINEI